ncbi:MAG: HINT domain-containing protein [bacterium]|nr:HINT domain-containing protein [bacterium]
MKKIVKPLIIIFAILVVIVPIAVLVATKPFKSGKDNKTTTSNKATTLSNTIPEPIELPGGVSTDIAAKVYASVAVELMSSGYDVFNAVKITSEGSEYGLGYTDYNTSYTSDEYSKTFLSSGFISFANEKNVVKNNDLTFINEIDEFGNEIYDENYSFVYSFNEGNIKKGHFIYNQKYIKYEVIDGLLKIDELECKKENYDLSIGSIYNYDLSDFEFIPYDEIDSSPDEAIPLIKHLDGEKIKEELENIIIEQNENGYKVEGIYISYISNEVLEAYNKKYTQIDSLNGYSFETLNQIEYDNETQYLCFGSDGDIYVRDLPPIPVTETKKGLWDYVVDGLVLVGAGAVAVVGIVASPYTGGASLMLTGAAIGAGVQYFSETIIEGKKFNEVNWTKVAIMSVSGAIGAAVPCAGVAGYFAAGVIGGLTSGIMTAIDGGSSEEILLSSVKGATISVLTHGLFASCFVEGTQVLTNKGLINIENIKKGMLVLSFNELLGITEYKEVLEVYENSGSYFTDVTLDNGEIITSTYTHPYYVSELGQYVKAGYLEQGMKLLDKEGKQIRIASVSNYYKNDVVFNMNVRDNHNYYVGNTSVLVHNDCATLSNQISIDSEAVKGMAKTFGKALISKPAIATYTGIIAGGYVITNSQRDNNVNAVKTTSSKTEEAITISINNVDNNVSDPHLKGIIAKAESLLNDSKNKDNEDYGWTKEDLDKALSDSFNVVRNGELVKTSEIDETNTEGRKKPRVYLGKNADKNAEGNNYKEQAIYDSKEKGIVSHFFSIGDDLWKELEGKHTKDGMWLLNKAYLDYYMSLDCIFVLVTPPRKYCTMGGKRLDDSYYAEELEYIHFWLYHWKSNDASNQEVERGK